MDHLDHPGVIQNGLFANYRKNGYPHIWVVKGVDHLDHPLL